MRHKRRARREISPPPLRVQTVESVDSTAPKRTNGRAILERLDTLFRADGSGQIERASMVLEAAGFRVLSRVRVPAGLMLVVDEA